MCADRELERWGIRFNASHFYPADTRRHGIRASHPSYVTKGMCGSFFMAVFQKMGALSQKRRVAAVSSSLPSPGVMPRTRQESGGSGQIFQGLHLDYRSPFDGDGARAEKIGRRSSTALHVWSGRADASSSEVP